MSACMDEIGKWEIREGERERERKKERHREREGDRETERERKRRKQWGWMTWDVTNFQYSSKCITCGSLGTRLWGAWTQPSLLTTMSGNISQRSYDFIRAKSVLPDVVVIQTGLCPCTSQPSTSAKHVDTTSQSLFLNLPFLPSTPLWLTPSLLITDNFDWIMKSEGKY